MRIEDAQTTNGAVEYVIHVITNINTRNTNYAYVMPHYLLINCACPCYFLSPLFLSPVISYYYTTGTAPQSYTLMVNLETNDTSIYSDHWCVGATTDETANTHFTQGYRMCNN